MLTFNHETILLMAREGKGRRRKKTKYAFFGGLGSCCIDVQKACRNGHRARGMQDELQVQGYPLSLGTCCICRQPPSRGYHRLLTSCNRFAESPGNLVPVLDRLLILRALESCVGNV